MPLADKQRIALIETHGAPRATVNFDIFHDGELAMWTNFNHGDDFEAVKTLLIQMRDHLSDFINDGNMCPFRNIGKQ